MNDIKWKWTVYEMARLHKWEISLLAAALVTLTWYAMGARIHLCWWTTAFPPLCDTLFTAESSGEAIILRSKLAELLSSCL